MYMLYKFWSYISPDTMVERLLRLNHLWKTGRNQIRADGAHVL